MEVCTNQVWGCVCSTGFDVTDAYVVCRELELGISGIHVTIITVLNIFSKLEPTVFINSNFGDGNEAIVYSDVQCGGYEGSLSDCVKQHYGSFHCSRSKIVGIVCRDSKFIFIIYINVITFIISRLF